MNNPLPELSELTVLVITFNEEANIARTLGSLEFAPRILLLDSFSTDRTLEIAAQFGNVQIIQNEFLSFADQCNFGLEHVSTEWVLSIDADYVFPKNCGPAVGRAMSGSHQAYRVSFDYWVFGKPVHGGILPARTVLFRKAGVHYLNDGHSHGIETNGSIGELPFRVAHDDRKPLRTWCSSQIRYAEQEAKKLHSAAFASLGFADKLRKLIVIAPLAVFIYVYFVRGGLLSGWRGLFYALQRVFAELLNSLFQLQLRMEIKKK